MVGYEMSNTLPITIRTKYWKNCKNTHVFKLKLYLHFSIMKNLILHLSIFIPLMITPLLLVCR